MKTDIRIIRKEEQHTGTWAGGTTTQLAIRPPEADYRLRNFEWRMSSARVDLEESPFTSLSGFHRLIMILEGKVRLIHEGHHEITLDTFDQDSFEGSWNTLSRGRCVDFNLMTAEGCCGRLEALRIPLSLTLSLFPPLHHSLPCEITEAFYSLEAGLKLTVVEGEERFEATLGRGDFAVLRQGAPFGDAEAFFVETGRAAVPAVRATVWKHP